MAKVHEPPARSALAMGRTADFFRITPPPARLPGPAATALLYSGLISAAFARRFRALRGRAMSESADRLTDARAGSREALGQPWRPVGHTC